MSGLPQVDVNLFVHDGAATVAAAIESVLNQSWPNIRLTLIDDGSSDSTPDILSGFAQRDPRIRLKHNRHNGGAIANFQRAFWFGNADFVMPKSGDDLITPDFIERTMAVLLANPDCAMCHAGGLVFTDTSDRRHLYPAGHALHAVGPDKAARARHVMQTYTSSPSFWGVYRRDAVDQLAPIRFRAGWDHALLAELALYGEIRHVPSALYSRRDGGKPLVALARAATEQGTRGISPGGPLGELRWRTPLITTAYAHLETFAAVRLPGAERLALMADAADIFRRRWPAGLRQEAATLRADLPELLAGLSHPDPMLARWRARTLGDAIRGVEAILPDEDFTAAQLEIAALSGYRQLDEAA
jgi:glycosyltransferase involved in cell wall biosynthesis